MTSALDRDPARTVPVVPGRESSQLIDFPIFADRRSSHPIDRLSRELNEACTTAVTAHQIAALLEAEGLNDRIVQERYARSGVFSLAVDLYSRVPLRRSGNLPAETDRNEVGAQRSTLALVMRGPIYLVPVLFFIAAGELLQRERMLWAGLLALLFAWAWNQGFGALVHRLIGRGNVPGAHRLSRLSLAAGTTLIPFTVWAVSVKEFGDGSVVLFAAGQTAYLIAAATLLTFGKDRLLILMLFPGVAVVLTSFVIPSVPDRAVVAATITTLSLVVLAMFWISKDGNRSRVPRMTRIDVSIIGFHAVLGAVWAMLIGLAGFSIIGTSGVVGMVSLAAAPMVLTMGVAEWQLLQLRRNIRTLLITTEDPEEFARRARIGFARSTAIFSSTLIVVAVLISLGAYLSGAIAGPGVMLAFGFVWLGTAFFAGLALVSMGRIVIPLSGSIFLAVVMAFLLVTTSYGSLAAAGLYAVGCFGLCVALVAAVSVVIPKAVAHR